MVSKTLPKLLITFLTVSQPENGDVQNITQIVEIVENRKNKRAIVVRKNKRAIVVENFYPANPTICTGLGLSLCYISPIVHYLAIRIPLPNRCAKVFDSFDSLY